MQISFVAADADNGRNVVMELQVPVGTTHGEITVEYFNFLRAIGYVIDYDTQEEIISTL